MSRIGKNPITIESGVTVTVEKGGDFNHQLVKVKGPKGELSLSVRKGIDTEVNANTIIVSRKNESKVSRSYHGLYRSLMSNMIEGVTKGFVKELQLVGVGYRANMKGTTLELSLGLSHPVEFTPPEGIGIEVADKTEIKITGADKQKVGLVASLIREIRKPEPYKGKGIRYKDERVRRKAGKAAASAE